MRCQRNSRWYWWLVSPATTPNSSTLTQNSTCRIALAPAFAGIQHFPEGRGFKQWTGDDSKALMKVKCIFIIIIIYGSYILAQVYLPAIEGCVPEEMVLAMQAFIDFCYIARQDIHDMHSLKALNTTLECFHQHRDIFKECGIRIKGFNLPHQHSMIHYIQLIHAFGTPNGLCSSITESKHIKAVKEPWRRSNRWDALGQMLITNSWLDKLAATRVGFAKCGMLEGTCLSWILIKLGMIFSIIIIFLCWLLIVGIVKIGRASCRERV